MDLLPLLRERLHLRFLLTADQRVCRKKIWEQVESIQLTPALGQGYCWTLKGQMIKRKKPEPVAIQVQRKTRRGMREGTRQRLPLNIHSSAVCRTESKFIFHLMEIFKSLSFASFLFHKILRRHWKKVCSSFKGSSTLEMKGKYLRKLNGNLPRIPVMLMVVKAERCAKPAGPSNHPPSVDQWEPAVLAIISPALAARGTEACSAASSPPPARARQGRLEEGNFWLKLSL